MQLYVGMACIMELVTTERKLVREKIILFLREILMTRQGMKMDFEN